MYEVSEIDKNKDYAVENLNEQINSCTKIETFYGKLILYANGTPNIYKSFSGKDTWFSMSGIIPFNNMRQEDLVKIIPIDNALLGFTSHSITALLGKGDDINYEGYPYEPFSGFVSVEQGIGAIAPETVAKLDTGAVIFLSSSGLRVLDSLSIDSQSTHSKRVDNAVANIISADPTACAVTYDDVFYLSIPQDNRIFKWYYNMNGIYGLDEGDELTFYKLYNLNGRLIGLNDNEKILRRYVISNPALKSLSEQEYSNKGYFQDDGADISVQIGTKELGFDYDENLKRLFMVDMGFNSVIDEQIKLYVNIYADGAPLITVLDNQERVQEDSQGFEIFDNETISENTEADVGVVLGNWELGQAALGFFETTYRQFVMKRTIKALRFRLVIANTQDSPLQLFHIAFHFQAGYIPRSGAVYNR